MLTRADRWLIAVILAVSLLGIGCSWYYFFRASGAAYAEVYLDGRLVRTMKVAPGLHEELRLGDSEHYNVIEVRDGGIRVRESDCPDQICVRSGWIRTYPQQLVCVPYRVVVKMVNNDNDLDDITR